MKKIIPDTLESSGSSTPATPTNGLGKDTGSVQPKQKIVDNGGLLMPDIQGPYNMPHSRENIEERGGLYVPTNGKRPGDADVTATFFPIPGKNAPRRIRGNFEAQVRWALFYHATEQDRRQFPCHKCEEKPSNFYMCYKFHYLFYF
jgi:hypothetical protein